RLGEPSTWRRVWMSFMSGMFLATIVAALLELIASAVLATFLQAGSPNVSQLNTNNPSELLLTGLLLSVIAPLAEEGLKPVGPLVILGRLRGPAEAFLLGMAAGIGFDVFETTGYITQGQADWIIVAVERVGAGLLHGVGAGMATMGWYYLFRGRGASNRYLKGFGALAYAVLQHGIFNGSNFLEIIPGPIGDAMRAPVWFFGLPETGIVYLFIVIYAIIIGVLLTVTYYLRQSPLNRPPEAVMAASPPPQAPAAPPYPAAYPQMPPAPSPAGAGPGGIA
ncbi:MAG TPA: PrsW family glutamic-type intramembrane protease, partial [Ktedonobacterales bacterium]|nr:PrsW family glutamic-type intramembrane protease [Ktedonobacterales bacterium]